MCGRSTAGQRSTSGAALRDRGPSSVPATFARVEAKRVGLDSGREQSRIGPSAFDVAPDGSAWCSTRSTAGCCAATRAWPTHLPIAFAGARVTSPSMSDGTVYVLDFDGGALVRAFTSARYAGSPGRRWPSPRPTWFAWARAARRPFLPLGDVAADRGRGDLPSRPMQGAPPRRGPARSAPRRRSRSSSGLRRPRRSSRWSGETGSNKPGGRRRDQPRGGAARRALRDGLLVSSASGREPGGVPRPPADAGGSRAEFRRRPAEWAETASPAASSTRERLDQPRSDQSGIEIAAFEIGGTRSEGVFDRVCRGPGPRRARLGTPAGAYHTNFP